jgi:flagella basal body P-ring formation protein FlgA
MVSHRLTGIALVAALALAAASHAAESRTDPGRIRASVEHFVATLAPAGSTVHATAGPLDPRLNLAECAGELTPFLPTGATIRARMTVGVRCPGPATWSIYVPVTVESDATVLVARRPLSPGEVPAPEDLERVQRRIPGLGTQYLGNLADIVGRRLRRPVAAGAPVPTDALSAAVLVQRGQQVTVVAELSGIAVRAGAVALDAGAYGERIRARNAVSGRIIEGVVQADGTLATGP